MPYVEPINTTECHYTTKCRYNTSEEVKCLPSAIKSKYGFETFFSNLCNRKSDIVELPQGKKLHEIAQEVFALFEKEVEKTPQHKRNFKAEARIRHFYNSFLIREINTILQNYENSTEKQETKKLYELLQNAKHDYDTCHHYFHTLQKFIDYADIIGSSNENYIFLDDCLYVLSRIDDVMELFRQNITDLNKTLKKINIPKDISKLNTETLQACLKEYEEHIEKLKIKTNSTQTDFLELLHVWRIYNLTLNSVIFSTLDELVYLYNDNEEQEKLINDYKIKKSFILDRFKKEYEKDFKYYTDEITDNKQNCKVNIYIHHYPSPYHHQAVINQQWAWVYQANNKIELFLQKINREMQDCLISLYQDIAYHIAKRSLYNSLDANLIKRWKKGSPKDVMLE
jgi:hypothetical protein